MFSYMECFHMSRHDTHAGGMHYKYRQLTERIIKAFHLRVLTIRQKTTLKHFIGITLHLHQSKSFRICYKPGCFIHFAISTNDISIGYKIRKFETWNRETFCTEFERVCPRVCFSNLSLFNHFNRKHGENLVKNNINSI